jgi:RNA recognition motif-containing protein
LRQRDIQFRYNAIWLRDVPAEQFLKSEFSEEILFAVLAKFPENQAPEIVEQVIENIRKRAGQNLEFERFSEQLRILGKLRNLQPLIESLMEKISRYVSMEDDPWFVKGEQKGKLKEQRQFVVNLIQATDFDDKKIASLAAADIAFVRQVRTDLAQKGKKK